MTTTERRRPMAAGAVAVLAALVLAACPGAESDLPADVRVPPASVAGLVVAGPSYTLDTQGLRIIGSQGFARDTGPSCGLNQPYRCASADRYEVRVQQLAPPYLLRAGTVRDGLPENDQLYGVALGEGTAHLTALTTLQMHQLAETDPQHAFGFGQSTPFAVNAAALEDAQRKVTLFLRQALGIEVQSGATPFHDGRFVPAAGDPMYDTLVALDQWMVAQGTGLNALGARIALQARRCRTAAVTLGGAGERLPFCPAARSTLDDAAAPGVTAFSFGSDLGETLQVRADDAQVQSVRYDDGRGSVWQCEAAGCAGVTLGAPRADTTRDVTFAGATLSGPAGSVSLAGTLASAPAGLDLPALACSDNRFDLAVLQAATQSLCAQLPRDGVDGVRMDGERGGREVYTLRDDNLPIESPKLEVIVEGDELVSVLAYHVDPGSGLPVADWMCRRDACDGASLGIRQEDRRFGSARLTRRLALAGTHLFAVQADGTLDPAVQAVVHAGMLLQRESASQPMQNLPCGDEANALDVSIAGAGALRVCPPVDPQGAVLLGQFANADGSTGYFITSLAASADGSATSTSDGVTVTVDAAGAVLRVDASLFGGTTAFACGGTQPCAGVTVAPPDGNGAVTITVSGLSLRERDTGGVPGERQAGLSGTFTVAPP